MRWPAWRPKRAPGTAFPGHAAGGDRRPRWSWRRPDDQRDNTDHAENADQRRRRPRKPPASSCRPATAWSRRLGSQRDPGVIGFDGTAACRRRTRPGYDDRRRPEGHDPISRISRWESTRGHVARLAHRLRRQARRRDPAARRRVILTNETDSDDIKLTDTNGDGIADKREVVYTGIGQSDAPTSKPEGRLVEHGQLIYTTATRSASAGRRTGSCANVG